MLVCKPAMSSALLFPYLVFLSLMASCKINTLNAGVVETDLLTQYFLSFVLAVYGHPRRPCFVLCGFDKTLMLS
jgi:hypothetical protein